MEENVWTTYVIPIASGVLPILAAGAGALLRVCRMLREIQEQNVIQNTQLVALARAVEQLQQWAMGREGR